MTVKNREEHFWSKVVKKKDHECWNFKGSTHKTGYGQFYNGNTMTYAHRYAYESFYHRTIPEGLLIMHACDNKICCNPLHLFIGDDYMNAHDKVVKGRGNYGHSEKTRFSKSKLRAGEIWLVRKLKILVSSPLEIHKYKFSSTYVAKMFKVNSQTILNI